MVAFATIPTAYWTAQDKFTSAYDVLRRRIVYKTIIIVIIITITDVCTSAQLAELKCKQ